MGATFVVDASVVVDFYTVGSETQPATRLLDALRWPDPIAILAPDLVFLETGNALRKLAARGGISKRDADRAVSALGVLPIAPVDCGRLLGQAWSLRANLSLYDAAYVALARELDLPFITADRRAAKGAKGAGVRCWHVSERELHDLLDSLEPSARPSSD